jgi:FtsZ-binding cell division protein ZapB
MVLANVTVKASQWVYDKVNEVKVSTGLTQQEALDLIFKDYISTISTLQIRLENLEKDYKKLQEERDNLKKSLDEKGLELSKCLKALKG